MDEEKLLKKEPKKPHQSIEIESISQGAIHENQREISVAAAKSGSPPADELPRLHHVIQTFDRFNIINEMKKIFHRKSPEEMKKLANEKYKTKTPLHFAASLQSEDKTVESVIEMLIKKNAIIDEVDDHERTPLHYAARSNNVRAAKALIHHSNEKKIIEILQKRDNEGKTPFEIACAQNSEDVMKVFLKNRKLVLPSIESPLETNLKPDATAPRSTFLHYLARCDQPMLQAYFEDLESGVDNVEKWRKEFQKAVNTKDGSSLTPFQIIVQRGFSDIVEKICTWIKWEHGAIETIEKPVETDDCFKKHRKIRKKHKWLLHIAAAAGNLDSFLTLRQQLEYEFNEPNDDDETPAHFAARFNNKSIIGALINIVTNEGRDKKSLFKKNKKGMTPLLLTAQTNAWDCAEMLINDGLYKKLPSKELFFDKNERGENLLTIATAFNHPEFVTILIKKMETEGLRNTEFLPSRQARLIQRAAQCGSLEGTRTLLKESVKITGLNAKGESVLHFAARAGYLDVVQELLQNQSIHLILNAKDIDQRTPLHVAAELDYAEICQALLQKGADAGARATIKKFPDSKVDITTYSMTAFDLAIWKGSLQSVKVLQKYYSINGEQGCKMAPLHYAADSGDLMIVQYLLKAKEEPIELAKITEDGSEKTALDIALDNGREDVAKELLLQDDWHHLMQRTKLVFDDGISYSPEINNLYVITWVSNDRPAEAIAKVTQINGVEKKTLYEVSYTDAEGNPQKEWLERERFIGAISTARMCCRNIKKNRTYMVKRILNESSKKAIAKVVEISINASRVNGCYIPFANQHLYKISYEDDGFTESITQEQFLGTVTILQKLETPMRRLIVKFPRLAAFVMGRCIERKENKTILEYDFKLIDDMYVVRKKKTGGNEVIEPGYDDFGCVLKDANLVHVEDPRILKEHPLMLMANSAEEESKKLLEHELVSTLLKYRWKFLNRYIYFTFALLPFIFYLLFYTIMFVFMSMDSFKGVQSATMEPIDTQGFSQATTEETIPIIQNQRGLFEDSSWWNWGVTSLSLILGFFLIGKEVFQWSRLGTKNYFGETNENLIELFGFLPSFILVIWRFSELWQKTKFDWAIGIFPFWPIAVISFLGLTLNLLMLLISWGTVGLNILMFKRVAFSSWRLTILLAILLASFSFSFFFLLQNEREFKNPLYAILKVLVMSTGEFDYGKFLDDWKKEELIIRFTSAFVFLVFVVVVMILFMNLYTGVAVDNIEKIQDEATIEELIMKAKSMLMQGLLHEPIMRTARYEIDVDYSKARNSYERASFFLFSWWKIVRLCWLSGLSSLKQTEIENLDGRSETSKELVNLYSKPEDKWQKWLRKRETDGHSTSEIRSPQRNTEEMVEKMQITMKEMEAQLREIMKIIKTVQREPPT